MASNATKGKKHRDKMARKREIKAARRAKYLALKGTSKKTKRQTSKSQVRAKDKHAHVMADCGNQGCQKCHKRPTNQQIVLARLAKLKATSKDFLSKAA